MTAERDALVVKIGGEAIADPAILRVVAQDVAALQVGGARVVVVHGGGPQATALSVRLGLTPRIVAGRRITDRATLDVMKMAVAGQACVDLAAALHGAGARAVPTSGAGGLVAATRRPPRVVAGGGPDPIDFGEVGDVTAVDADALRALLRAGIAPLIGCLGVDDAGAVYNINADTVATAVAEALGCPLVMLTGAPGVLADPDDPASRIPRLSAAEFAARVADGSVRGGMLPKLEESFRVLAGGRVPAIHVLPAGLAGAVGAALRQPGAVGTALTP